MESELCSLFWKGYNVAGFTWIDKSHLLVELSGKGVAFCGRCQQACLQVHDTVQRTVRDCDLLDRRLSVRLPVRRVNCPDCGVCREQIPWLHGSSQMTCRLVRCVEELCKVLPIKHVAARVGLSWSTVKRVDKARLLRELPLVKRSEVSHLVIDEFALHKGHRYAIVVADADTRQVLWIGPGRSRKALRPFFQELGEHAGSIKAVAMDQNSAFDLEVKMHCPQAEVVYDLFHVVARYGREVIDRVRVDQANALREDKPARSAVKRSRWLLLKNRSNLSEKQEAKLSELMEANQPLATVYVLKEQLKELWRCSSAWAAFKLWRQWWSSCQESALKPLLDFARKLLPYLRGILASAKYPLNTSVLEGMNNKIKVIKRMAYGYRDTEYFFLKIKHAFPAK